MRDGIVGQRTEECEVLNFVGISSILINIAGVDGSAFYFEFRGRRNVRCFFYLIWISKENGGNEDELIKKFLISAFTSFWRVSIRGVTG